MGKYKCGDCFHAEICEKSEMLVDFSRDNPAYCGMFLNSADVAEVVHGRWEAMHYEGGILDGTNFDKCSVCGYERIFEDEKLKTAFKYCPNCGCKMDLEGNR